MANLRVNASWITTLIRDKDDPAPLRFAESFQVLKFLCLNDRVPNLIARVELRKFPFGITPLSFNNPF